MIKNKISTVLLLLLLQKLILINALVPASQSSNTAPEESICPSNSQYISLLNTDSKKCYTYGCPMYPLDIISEEDRTELLKIATEEASMTTSSSRATLTLTGNKSAANKKSVQLQVNQDRAFVVPHYRTESSIVKKLNDNEICISSKTDAESPSLLLGVFDGHGHEGEVVSEHAVQEVPRILHHKLTTTLTEKDDDNLIKEALIQTFLEVNATVPAAVMGGATASVILQLGSKMYFANAGDSRSFLALVRITDGDDEDKASKGNHVEIIYVTEEDKPNVPRERERIESVYGGKVYMPPDEKSTSRVVYQSRLGNTVGLAMSRSIGDWDASASGVIATPTVDVISLKEVLSTANQQCNSDTKEGDAADCSTTSYKYKLFAVSATDGLLDTIPLQTIADTLANSLYYDATASSTDTDAEKEEKSLLGTCYRLIVEAAHKWGDRYRDDIALSVSDIQLPSVLDDVSVAI